MKKPEHDKAKLREVANQIDSESFSMLFSEYIKERNEALENYYKENPIDAPNDVLNHAVINGLRFSADGVLAVGDYLHLFDIGMEKFYSWTAAEDDHSLLVAHVNPAVKEMNMWKTGASILHIAFALINQLEHTLELDYDWVYRFKPSTKIDDLHFLNEREYSYSYNVKQIPDLERAVETIELLSRDERFYVATQNIIAAKHNHEFCQVCALTPEHHKKHFDKEPEIWERALMIPQMEAAIVQATRAVEAILGKPGDRENSKKLQRAKERWKESIYLEPEDTFQNVGVSFIDYYYKLFNLRGFAAHSLGKLSFDLTRKLTIDAQSFAWIVISKYFEKHHKDYDDAAKSINFNVELVKQFPDNYSSPLTKRT